MSDPSQVCPYCETALGGTDLPSHLPCEAVPDTSFPRDARAGGSPDSDSDVDGDGDGDGDAGSDTDTGSDTAGDARDESGTDD